MKAITNIDTSDTKANFGTSTNPATSAAQGQTKGKPESELRATARRHGLNLKDLADRMGVNYGYLSSVASGRRPWSSHAAGEGHGGPGRGPRPGVRLPPGGHRAKGESTFIRERARAAGPEPEGVGPPGGGVGQATCRRWPGAGRT